MATVEEELSCESLVHLFLFHSASNQTIVSYVPVSQRMFSINQVTNTTRRPAQKEQTQLQSSLPISSVQKKKRGRPKSVLDPTTVLQKALKLVQCGAVPVSNKTFKNNCPLTANGLDPQPIRQLCVNESFSSLFLSFISQEIKRYLVEKLNERIHLPSGKGRKPKLFCIAEVEAIFRIYVDRINSDVRVNDYFRQPDRLGYWTDNTGAVQCVTESRYQKFNSLLTFDPEHFFALFSASLNQHIRSSHMTGVLCVACDESMIECTLRHAWIVVIPRKPVPQGFRVYLICAILRGTLRPIVLWMIPDFWEKQRMLQPKVVMEQAMQFLAQKRSENLYPQIISITMDALFYCEDLICVFGNIITSLDLLEVKSLHC
jgi:hypothetical protein